MEILNKIKDLLLSPRFTSFYWRTGSVAVIGFLDMIAENVADLGLPGWAVIVLGLALAEGTKAIKNYVANKPLGFSR